MGVTKSNKMTLADLVQVIYGLLTTKVSNFWFKFLIQQQAVRFLKDEH